MMCVTSQGNPKLGGGKKRRQEHFARLPSPVNAGDPAYWTEAQRLQDEGKLEQGAHLYRNLDASK